MYVRKKLYLCIVSEIEIRCPLCVQTIGYMIFRLRYKQTNVELKPIDETKKLKKKQNQLSLEVI